MILRRAYHIDARLVQSDGIERGEDSDVSHLGILGRRVAVAIHREVVGYAYVEDLVGDGKGKVGYGLGKAAEVPEAIRKGIEDAKKNMINVSLSGSTIPHEIIGEAGAGRVLMKPAAPGTGVIAGGPVRIIMEAAGIKDIRTKCLRSNTAVNVVAATFEGLKSLRTPEEVARTRGKSVDEIVG